MRTFTIATIIATTFVTACGGASTPSSPAPGAKPPSLASPVAGDPAPPADQPLPPLPPRPPLGPAPAACTEMGCRDGANLSLRRAAWPAGAYQVTVDADGLVTTCTLTISATTPIGNGELATCTGSDGVELSHYPGGLDLDMMLRGTPRRVQLTIADAGGIIYDEAIVPTYTWITANGPGCGPQCLQGNQPVALP